MSITKAILALLLAAVMVAGSIYAVALTYSMIYNAIGAYINAQTRIIP